MLLISRHLASALCLGLTLAACGGGGNASTGDSNDSTAPTTPAPPDKADARSACQQDFSPQRVDAGEQCAPRYGDFCASTFGDGSFTYDAVIPCDGVQIDEVITDSEESFNDTLQYVVLRPANAEPRAVVVNLHFRQLLRSPITAASTHAVQMRMAELVKARNVMVILPGAPGGVWPQTNLSNTADGLFSTLQPGALLENIIGDSLADSALVDSLVDAGVPIGFVSELFDEGGTLGDLGDALGDISPINSVEDFMDYIELSRDDALARFGGADLPQFISGLSNGGLYALRFACQRPDGIDAMMSVASSMGPVEAEDCKGAPPIGTVQVHGASDIISPYDGIPGYPVRGGDPALPLPVPLDLPLSIGLLDGAGLFLDTFAPNNNCGGELLASVIPAGVGGRGDQGGDVVVERFQHCDNSQGRSSILVTPSRSGHSWPGYDAPSGNTVNVFGAVSYDFDATLYGFDLMWQAAGLD